MKIKNTADLRIAILELEKRKQQEKLQLADSFHALTESLTPSNIIRNSFKKVNEIPGLKGSLVNGALSLGLGLASKKLLIGKSAGLLKKVAGLAVEMGVAGMVANNAGVIKSATGSFLKKIFRSKAKAGMEKLAPGDI